MTRKIINPGRGYSGREKQKLFLYDKNGKYLKSYESQQDLRNEYFPSEENKRPLFNSKKWKHFKYDVLPDGCFYSNYRIGRENLLKFERISNSKYCFNNAKHDKPVEVFNLLHEKIGEFKSSYFAHLLTGETLVTIYRDCKTGKGEPKSHYYFKYKTIQDDKI